VSGWIKLEKDLANDPRVLKMASRLSHADVTLGSRSRLVVVGALVTLWWYADTHIGDDDVLPIGADEVDQLVGLKGFCTLMPQDWLQILDADHVKLVDYVAHNGSLAKNKALAQKRQKRHREKPTSTSRSRHAPVTHDALPDKTETRQDRDKTEELRTTAAAPPTRAPKPQNVSGETDGWFLDFKLAYPSRAGDHGWRKALKAAHARVVEGHSPDEFIEGAKRYAEFCRVTGKEGTEYVKQAATFLGPDKPFLESWAPPATKADVRLASNLSAADEFMRRTEGMQ
jgi:hypothetical protein